LIWPVIDDEDSAREVIRLAATYAGVLCMFTILANLLSAAFERDLRLGAFVLPAFWAVCAWRIWNGSRPWAITAFVACSLLAVLTLLSLPLLWSVVMPFAFLGLMHGVRATSALRRFADERLMAELRTR